MSIEVKIPAVGESITSGVVSVWHRKSGEFVNAGEPLFTLETDKVSTEITAEKDGLLETIVNDGQEVKIGEVVATIDDSKSAPAKTGPAEKKATAEPKPSEKPQERSANTDQALSPAVRRIVEEEGVDPASVRGTGKDGRLTKGDVLKEAEDKSYAADTSPARTVPGKPTASPTAQTVQDRSASGGPDGRFTRKKMS